VSAKHVTGAEARQGFGRKLVLATGRELPELLRVFS